ncbi:MAG: hypothetical protein FJ109_02375 [Deltaproteobacteria bacterium]|nr:hypothetical protein [Deltaproteobacteria bacterium]
MNSLLLLTACLPLVIAVRPLFLSIFNRGLKEELEAALKERKELKDKLDRMEVRLEEKDKKIKKLGDQIETAQKDLQDEKNRCRQLKDDAGRTRKVEEESGRKEAAFQRQLETLNLTLAGVQKELVDAKERAARSQEDAVRSTERVKQVEAQLVQTRQELQARDAAPPPPPPPPLPQEPARKPREEKEQPERDFRAELRQVRKELFEKDLLLKSLRRKLEHNRRAYIITMMQLDLAQDELCLIKTGRIRRETQLAKAQVPAAPQPLIETADTPHTPADLDADPGAETPDDLYTEPAGDLATEPADEPSTGTTVEPAAEASIPPDPADKT